MTLDEILKILISAFAGGLIMSLTFVFTQSSKIASIDTKMSSLCDTLSSHLKEPYHSGSSSKLSVIESKLDSLERKLDAHINSPKESCNVHVDQIERLVKLSTEQTEIMRRMDSFERVTSIRLDRLEGRGDQ